MSLRAKIEAVVYAAEEPVTLPQLAAVFGDEVRALLAQPVTAETATASEGDGTESPETESGDGTGDASGTGDAAGRVDPEAEVEPEATATSLFADGEPAASAMEAATKRAARQQERAIREYLRQELDGLMAELTAGDRGVEIREIAGGYRMATKPEYHDAIRAFVKSLKPPMKLSLQALETLAVVAYKQPVTAPEITEIRGVESGGVLGGLLARKLIATAGRKQVIGRPILYKTTKEFLLRFGLKDLNELPSMEEFEKMAGELAEAELQDGAGLEDGRDPEAEVAAYDETGDAVRDPESREDPEAGEAEAASAAEVPTTETGAVATEANETEVNETDHNRTGTGEGGAAAPSERPPAGSGSADEQEQTADASAPEAE